MSCEGCSNAVKRILGKISDISSVETNLDTKEVIIKGNVTREVIEENLKPWATAYLLIYIYSAKKEVKFISVD